MNTPKEWAADRLLFGRVEVARLLDLSERTLDYLIANDRISSIKRGRRRLFTRDAILNYAGLDISDHLR